MRTVYFGLVFRSVARNPFLVLCLGLAAGLFVNLLLNFSWWLATGHGL